MKYNKFIQCVVGVCLLSGGMGFGNAQSNPTVSGAYLNYCMYYYKTTYYPAGNSSHYESLHTSSIKSSYYDDSSMYARYDNNGQVTVSRSSFIPAINNFNVAYGFGTSQVSHHRERARFAIDYDNPSDFPGRIDVTLRVSYESVDAYGNKIPGTGKTDIEDVRDIMPGTSGWTEILPSYMTKTTDYYGQAMWYAFINNGQAE